MIRDILLQRWLDVTSKHESGSGLKVVAPTCLEQGLFALCQGHKPNRGH